MKNRQPLRIETGASDSALLPELWPPGDSQPSHSQHHSVCAYVHEINCAGLICTHPGQSCEMTKTYEKQILSTITIEQYTLHKLASPDWLAPDVTATWPHALTCPLAPNLPIKSHANQTAVLPSVCVRW